MRYWLILVVAGCTTTTNAQYCDTTCSTPGMVCDTVKHQCVGGTPDLSVGDLGTSVDDLTVPGGDLTGADFSEPDLTPPPACLVSASCPDAFPVCDPTQHICRTCDGNFEDPTCVMRSAATPVCKLSGTNAGLCAACNVNADCAAATPICNPDGTCRLCQSNDECDSKICNFGVGSCIDKSDIVYVDSKNDTGQASCSETGKDGTKGTPYCQITTALTLVGISTKHFVHVQGSDNPYDGFEVTSTNGTLTFIGPGKDAAKPATVHQALAGADTILIDPGGTNSVSVGLSGFVVTGGGNGRALVCDGSGTMTPDLTAVDCAFSTSTKAAVFINGCGAKITESRMSSAGIALQLATNSQYNIQNCFMFNSQTGVEFDSTNGKFAFNSIANNGNGAGGQIGVTCNAAANIADSIVFNNKKTGMSQFNGSTTCNLIAVVTGTDSVTSSGKIQIDPAFMGVNDLHLNVTPGANLTANQACCIDKINGPGPTPSPSPLPSVDIDSNPRPKGLHWDIGADEAM